MQNRAVNTLDQDLVPSTAQLKGAGMVVSGAIMWGISGVCAQILFNKFGFAPAWLVSVRMTVSGILLLLATAIGNRSVQHVSRIWRSKKDVIHLIVYSMVGLVGVQYTYFASIQLGNAATATLLQYLGPVFIVLYLALRQRKLPTHIEFISVLLALTGTYLLITDGKFTSLAISSGAVGWGITSALTLAFYTLYPGEMIRKYGAASVVGWAMFVGGLLMSLYARPWQTSGRFALEASALIAFVVLFGTLIAFYLYLRSLEYISPSATSLFACTEPLAAVVVSVLVVHVHVGMWAMVGGLLIVVTVLMLARAKD